MPRLARPHVPVEARCRVILRQIGEMFPNDAIFWHGARKGGLGRLLASRLAVLAELLRCEVTELRLDHDPALAIRKKLYRTPNGGHVWTFEILKEGEVVRYEPDANDPTHLRYRPHAAQHAGSHHIKTNVRGDGAQHPDRVLIKKLRRRKAKRTRAIPRRVVRKIAGRPIDVFKTATGPARKFKWARGRKLQGRPFERKKR